MEKETCSNRNLSERFLSRIFVANSRGVCLFGIVAPALINISTISSYCFLAASFSAVLPYYMYVHIVTT